MKRNRQPSQQMSALLQTLAADPGAWHYGYTLMKAVGLSSGTLYPLLARMHERGLLESEWHESSQDGRPSRHAYRLTAEGAAVAREIEPSLYAGGASQR
jgi:DNA-binding PadR family transcriptional regulator